MIVVPVRPEKLTYRFLFLFGFLMTSLLPYAAPASYAVLPDSLRTAVRLKAHLLVSISDFSQTARDSLLLLRVPLALYEKDIILENGEWVKKLALQQNLIPVYGTGSSIKTQQDQLVPIRESEADRVQLPAAGADSLFADSLFSFRELLLADPGASAGSRNSLFFALWSQSGKLPGLIPGTPANYRQIAPLVRRLNATQKIFGAVRSGDKLLGGVSWKGYPHARTNGYFCFPLIQGKSLPLVPYKAGYRFSPDIIYDSPDNRGYLKEFKALALTSDFELTDHFIFNNRISNLVRKNDREIITTGVKLIRDPDRGECAWFEDRAYLDAGTQSREALRPNFTITAWIKPAKLGNNNSILGKGTHFVLKLHNGMLTYTMQGIKDYISRHSPIPVNQWSFISLVHSAYENRIRFYVNGKLTEQADLISPYTESDNTLLIGSNLWEEFFVGAIGEIKIWQRELNEEEIFRQYSGTPEETKGSRTAILLPVGLGFLLLGASLLLKRKVSRKKKLVIHPAPTDHEHIVAAACEKILCFGGLHLINQEGADISRKLSPKLKQLFILIFLHSQNGQKGIDTQKLSEILWPGMSSQNAKNTRGTNIQNLKSVLASCSSIRLVFKDKLWTIVVDQSCYCDYTDALRLIEKLENLPGEAAVPVDDLKILIKIANGGVLFSGINESWLDPSISKTSDRIVETGLTWLERTDKLKYASLAYELADMISLHDPLNEPALNRKLELLTRQGKLGLARIVYDQFAKLYQELYQEPYPHAFRSTTSGAES